MQLIYLLCKLFWSQTVCRLQTFCFDRWTAWQLFDRHFEWAPFLQYGGRAQFFNFESCQFTIWPLARHFLIFLFLQYGG